MKKSFILAAVMAVAGLVASVAVAGASAGKVPDSLVWVKGGEFKNTKSNYYGKGVTVSDFYIGKYAVTQKEWLEVMGSNPAKFKGDNLPVERVSWYDSIEYCNKRSLKEGLKPYYNIQKNKPDPNNQPDPRFGQLDTVKWTVTINKGANGYRLPTEAEWEYAASGGGLSRSYTKPVGTKKPNELGLYDMSGNVRQWCWDWQGDLPAHVADPRGSNAGFHRVWKGGGWIGAAFCCASAFRGGLAANGTGPDQGLRVCRNK
jgi:formylglycine-generating enzyme required for sulfatase activity